jgi:hypothetical protein
MAATGTISSSYAAWLAPSLLIR